MSNVRRVYVEKKPSFAVKAKELKHEISSYLGIQTVTNVRELIRYDVENISDDVFEKACHTVFAEPPLRQNKVISGTYYPFSPADCRIISSTTIS